MGKVKVNANKCERCGYIWVPIKSNPVVCPKCKSPYWNKERRK